MVYGHWYLILPLREIFAFFISYSIFLILDRLFLFSYSLKARSTEFFFAYFTTILSTTRITHYPSLSTQIKTKSSRLFSREIFNIPIKF